eukprot:s3318_g4.t1
MWMEIHGVLPIRGEISQQVKDNTHGVLVMDSRGIYDAMELTSLAETLEASFARQKNILQDPAKLQQLSGKWRLLFSDAPEITGLANLPLGLAVGPVYQPIDVSSKIFENQSPIVQKLGLVKGNLRVVGTFAAAPLRSVNAAGVVNTCGNRIDVNFERLVFSVDQLAGISTGSFLQRVATPTRAPGAPQPAITLPAMFRSFGAISLATLAAADWPTPNWHGCVDPKALSLPYCNTKLSIQERLDDLMSRLDRNDKIRQITPDQKLGGAFTIMGEDC